MKKNDKALSADDSNLVALKDKCNAAIKAGNLPADMLSGFSALEAKYAEAAAKIVFDELLTQDLAFIAAVKKLTFMVKRHQVVTDKESKAITAIEIVEKEKQIDPLKFCKHGSLDTDWQYKVQKFNQLLCFRAATEMGMTAVEIKRIEKSFYLEKVAREIQMGGTPTSNNAVCKALQAVIDGMLSQDADKRTYKCNNHDVAFLLMCYTKKGKSALSVAVSKHDTIRKLIMEVLHRIICDKRYDLEYKGKPA
ncbi:MAG: hypothetical protein FWD58_08855 [Firmicutes bacterium]|nr:hypothetical protein [Bacillota bacterium]